MRHDPTCDKCGGLLIPDQQVRLKDGKTKKIKLADICGKCLQNSGLFEVFDNKHWMKWDSVINQYVISKDDSTVAKSNKMLKTLGQVPKGQDQLDKFDSSWW